MPPSKTATNQNGPRVKHVSRKAPAKLTISNYNNENSYPNYNYSYNKADNVYYIKNHLNLQSIENFQLRLSALPQYIKNSILRKFKTKMNKTKPYLSYNTSSTSLFDYNSDEDNDDLLVSLHNKQSSSMKIYRNKQLDQHGHGASSKRKLHKAESEQYAEDLDDSMNERRKKKFKRVSSNTSVNIRFDGSSVPNSNAPSIVVSWDDFFDRFHKISTSQNYRQQQYVRDINVESFPNNQENNDSNTSNNIKSERLKFKVDFHDILKRLNYFIKRHHLKTSGYLFEINSKS